VSAYGLLAGRLCTAPARDAGEAFAASAIIRVDMGAKHETWRLTAYGQLADELLAVSHGESIAVSGEIKTTLAFKDKTPAVGRFMTVRKLMKLETLPTSEEPCSPPQN
jgi:hypothetical protein